MILSINISEQFYAKIHLCAVLKFQYWSTIQTESSLFFILHICSYENWVILIPVWDTVLCFMLTLSTSEISSTTSIFNSNSWHAQSIRRQFNQSQCMQRDKQMIQFSVTQHATTGLDWLYMSINSHINRFIWYTVYRRCSHYTDVYALTLVKGNAVSTVTAVSA